VREPSLSPLREEDGSYGNLLDTDEFEGSDLTILLFEAKLDNFTHASHEGIQFLRLRVTAAKGGNRGDVITVLVLFNQDGEFSFWLHTNPLLSGVYHERQRE
jgi:hypothetical protein